MPRKKKKDDGKAKQEPRPKGAVGAFWSGTISFGLIGVPVRLYPANRRTSISLRMLDEDGTPLRRRYFCPEHDAFVENDEIVRGHDVGDGEFVVVTDDELDAISPGKSREIDLQRFVDASRIPPLYFERAYFLTPAGDSNKAYRLLAEVMEGTNRAGIATFVMRNKEYLVAILAEGGILRAETLRFQDELRDPEAIGLDDEPEVDEKEVKRFAAAIEKHMEKELDLEEMKDESGEALRKLVERKRKEGRDVIEVAAGSGNGEGEDVEAAEEFDEVDLLETIRTSLQSGNGAS